MDWFWRWTENYQTLLGGVFLFGCVLGIGLDLWLVLVRRTKSISLRTWLATKAHPTLLVAGTLLCIGISWLVRDETAMVWFAAYLGGHLFAHW